MINRDTQYFDDFDKQTVDDMMHEQIRDSYRVDPYESVEHPPVAISFGSHKLGDKYYPSPIVTYGNLCFIQAPPKSRKTFLTSLLSTAYLTDKNKYCGDLQGHREGRKLIHFDTEQGKFHCQRVFNRVAKMSDETSEGVSKDYITYGLRQLSNKEKQSFIRSELYSYEKGEIGVVIIDGVADLISDVNALDESNDIIQKLMTWSHELQCAIITVIHQNFGSEKPTGHLGSALEKKAETMIKVKKDGIYTDVECRESRNFPFDNFTFMINNYGFPIVADGTSAADIM